MIINPRTGLLTRRERFRRSRFAFTLGEMACNPATWMFAGLALEYALIPGVRPFARFLIIGMVAAPLYWCGFHDAANWLAGFI
jgi:hypothetical protein